METMIAYMMSFVPAEMRDSVVFYHSPDIALTRVSAFFGGKPLYAGPYYHIVFPSIDPPPIDIGGQKLYFTARKAIILPPLSRYKSQENLLLPKQYYYLLIKQELAEGVIRDVYGFPLTLSPCQCPVPTSVIDTVSRLETELREQSFGYAAAARNLASYLMTMLLREMSTGEQNENVKLGPMAVNKTLAYIHSHYDADIRLADLADISHSSPYSLIRQFKKQTGMTPHQYIQNLRLDKARQLIRDTGLKISEIAAMCGFVSASHFTSAYRSRYGATPSQMRDSQHGEPE